MSIQSSHFISILSRFSLILSLFFMGCSNEPSISEIKRGFQKQFFMESGYPVPDIEIEKIEAHKYKIDFNYLTCPNCGKFINHAEDPCPNHHPKTKRRGNAYCRIAPNGDIHFYIP